MLFFYAGLFLLSGATLMYEVVLTRLLSVVCWYYLAFVCISMAMFGMTAGALWVHLRPSLFTAEAIPRRLAAATLAMAISLPLALVTVLAVPIEISQSLETLFSFLIFTSVISVPFFFSGVGVCLALTRSPFPIARVYGVDLAGAALGCLGAIGLMEVLDAPSAILAISAILFVAAAAMTAHAGEQGRAAKHLRWALALAILACANAATLHGIQPIWSKGEIDRRKNLLAEVWSPISKVRVTPFPRSEPFLWGPSPRMPEIQADFLKLDIDNDAATPIYRFDGNLKDVSFLLYDVTSLAAQLRPGGSAAIIGMGGGRDVLTAAAMNFRRIVGIEVNRVIADMVTRRFAAYGGLPGLPQLEIQRDEGRTYLTRTTEKFDLIQASMVDTWAASSAGALTLTENGLYTVDAWRIFYRHLNPTGLLSFSRWNSGSEASQTLRLFSLATAALLAEGVSDPSAHLAVVGGGSVATLILSHDPMSPQDVAGLRALAEKLGFNVIVLPGESTADPALRVIASARTLEDLAGLRYRYIVDLSPTYDSAPFFFNSIRLRNLFLLLSTLGTEGNLRALAFLLYFLAAAVVLLVLVIVLPLVRHSAAAGGPPNRSGLAGGIAYFVAIGLGFLLVEMAMVQQLSIFLGQPIYSLAVVLSGLILATGAGSLLSAIVPAGSRVASRLPAAAACGAVAVYAAVVLPFIHRNAALVLWQRSALSLLLVAPCGLVMGFCFPVGLERMRAVGQESNLPWMWALNGAASVLASFLAVVVSMETSVTSAALVGAGCYAVAALVLPWKDASQPAQQYVTQH